jgi:hypothetical protein
MQRLLLAAVLAAACVVGCTPGFARNAGHSGHGHFVRDPTTRLGPSAPTPTLGNRIPAPLPSPAQAPVVNGPVSQPALRGLTGIGQR